MQIKGMQKSQIQNITHKFKTGNIVKIIDAGKSSDTSYTIIKLKKSVDGTPLYLFLPSVLAYALIKKRGKPQDIHEKNQKTGILDQARYEWLPPRSARKNY
jgi:hypothetical protein